MKLERFKKNAKQKKLIIGIIVGLILLIGGITLYRTFALYEEKKEFNILKGKVPDFKYDVKMAVTVDGKTVNEIPEKGLYDTTITCSGTAKGSWDYVTWDLTLAGFQSGERCTLAFVSNPNLTKEDLIANSVALRRNTYRGKNITDYWKDGSLYTMISNGTFDDIYVGDYIIDNKGNKWLIADLDNYLNSGDTALTKHHATIIPENPGIMNSQMNSTDTSADGYAGSAMYTTHLNTYLNTYIVPTFGSHIIQYRNALTNCVNGEGIGKYGAAYGVSCGYKYVNRKLDLMSEVNVYGMTVWSSSGYDTGIDNKQYAIFRLRPDLIFQGTTYWLKDVASRMDFAVVADVAALGHASGSGGIRPRFLID